MGSNQNQTEKSSAAASDIRPNLENAEARQDIFKAAHPERRKGPGNVLSLWRRVFGGANDCNKYKCEKTVEGVLNAPSVKLLTGAHQSVHVSGNQILDVAGGSETHSNSAQQQATSSSAKMTRPGTGGDKRKPLAQQHIHEASPKAAIAGSVASSMMSSHIDFYLTRQVKIDIDAVVPNSSIENEITGYKIGRILGRGNYSRICLTEALEGRTAAVKIIDEAAAPESFLRRFLPRDINVLLDLNHVNVIRTEAAMRLLRNIYIFMEFCENGDLLHYMQARGALPEPEAQKNYHQIVSGVQYLHLQNIAHGDLKCENILIAKNHRLVINGFARPCEPCEEVSQTFCGSAAYAAPEVMQGERYDPRMNDCWSIGVILFILVCGSMPFDDSDIQKMITKQKQKRFAFPSKAERQLSAEAKDLVSKCMEPDVNLRLSTTEMFAHYWLADQQKVGEVLCDEFERQVGPACFLDSIVEEGEHFETNYR